MLFVDLVIRLKVLDEFPHACRHRRINATHRERTFNFFCHGTPTGDARFSRRGRKLAVRDRMKVKLDKNEYATGAKDASEFAQEVRIVMDLKRERGWGWGCRENKVLERGVKSGTRPTPECILRACTTSYEPEGYGRHRQSRLQSSNLSCGGKTNQATAEGEMWGGEAWIRGDGHDVMMFARTNVQLGGTTLWRERHVPGGKCQVNGGWIESGGAPIRNFELTGVVVVQGPHP